MPLIHEQLRFFDIFGFLAFPGLSASERDPIVKAFEQVWAEHGGGHNGRPHDDRQRSCLLPFIGQSDYLSTLLDDHRIVGIASSLLGTDFNYLASDGNYYAGDTKWHSDGWRLGGYLSAKIACYLDPLNAETGALRVIPGSHRGGAHYADGLQAHVKDSDEHLGVSAQAVPAVLPWKPSQAMWSSSTTTSSMLPSEAANGGVCSR